MNQQLNDDDLVGAVRRLDPHDPLPPIDPASLLTRGRRGLRRRRLLSGAGLAAVVAAVAAASTAVPALLDDSAGPGPAGSVGTAGSPSTTASSATATKPAAASGDAALLATCGAAVHRDLSGWRIVTKGVEKGYLTTFVALDPAGKQRAECYVAGKDLPWEAPDAWNSVSPVSPPPTDVETVPDFKIPRGILPRHMFEQGTITCDQPGHPKCVGFLFYETGRLPLAAARIHAVASNGRTIDVPVKEGYYAVAWGDGHRDGMHPVDWKVYDANGKLLGSKPR